MRMYYVYIMASKPYGTLYVGVTNNIQRRVFEHKTKFNKGFTARYNIHQLVYYEEHTSIVYAIWREKCLKKRKRQWKVDLIEDRNLHRKDLAKDRF